MKQGWRTTRIGALCQVVAGQSPEGRFYNSEGNGMPFYQGKKDFGEQFVQAPTTWTTQTTKIARERDILMSVRAPVGPVNFATEEACIGRGLAAIRSGSEIDPCFLFYQLLQLQPEIAGKEGAVFPSISKSEIEALPIVVGSLSEQRRIVAILDEAFEGIATATTNAEKNRQNARAIFESQLQSVFSNRTGEWTDRTLSQVSKVFGRGKSRHRPRNEPRLYGGHYPFVQTGDVRNATVVIDSYTQTYSELGLAQSKLWPAGTVCITIAANIAESAILGFDGCFPDSIIGVIVDDLATTNKFLLYLLRSFKSHLQAQGKGSAQDNINVGTFEDLSFPFPSRKVQDVIVEQFDDLRAETLRLESLCQNKIEALEALKKSMLHQAFSGGI